MLAARAFNWTAKSDSLLIAHEDTGNSAPTLPLADSKSMWNYVFRRRIVLRRIYQRSSPA